MLSNKNKNLIVVELNEINFDIIKKYLLSGIKLPNFSKIIKFQNINTLAEKKYEEIEPWIQWHSVHTGLSLSDHKIFRLGDGIYCKSQNIYNKLEDYGFTVGAISPMNLTNNLSNPKYFIPDPWTRTSSDDNWWSKKISKALKQIVNDNAKSKVQIKSLFFLFITFIRFARIKNYLLYLNLAMTSFFGKRWRKSIFLDLLLNDLHMVLYKKFKPNYSSIFLNAGAHIQHHYFFNSKFNLSDKNPNWYINNKNDPLLDMLLVYDRILGSILDEKSPLIVATGLSQDFNERKEFYYRLKDHSDFLRKINVNFCRIDTRMSRDFEIHFIDNYQRDEAYKIMNNIKVNEANEKIFDEIEVRSKSLFVTLTYPNEIDDQTQIVINNNRINLKKHVVFVAIKNGKHQSKGYAYFSHELSKYKPIDNTHVKNIFYSIKKYFAVI